MSKPKIHIFIYLSGGFALIAIGIGIVYYFSFFIGLGCILLGSAVIIASFFTTFAQYCAIGGVASLILGALVLAVQKLLQ
ncbi:MAG: hypothetical protein HYY41_04115 [Chloroflexi bacterium]|nr:hypothetical protein [Chloroflexota bacterium]